MLPRVEWIVDPRASILHIAAGLSSRRPLVHADRAASLIASAGQLHEIAKRLADFEILEDWHAGHFWNAAIHATATATEDATGGLASEIASVLLEPRPDATTRRSELHARLAAPLAELIERGNTAFPRLAAEVELRLRPLREQWEARGPGLLTAVSKLTRGEFEFVDARVHAVYPIHGGCGCDHFPWPSVRIEVVLANVVPELPEIVRLAWLLATQSVRAREPAVKLVTIPIVLRAAEHVELLPFHRAAIAMAGKAWLSPSDDDRIIDKLFAWFDAYERNAATIADFAHQ